jgi:hypothetical protein
MKAKAPLLTGTMIAALSAAASFAHANEAPGTIGPAPSAVSGKQSGLGDGVAVAELSSAKSAKRANRALWPESASKR